jgi:hypothetical protein
MSLAQYYEIKVTQSEEIILRPRALVDPREVISRRTLEVLDEAMINLHQARAGEPIDLASFKGNDHEEAKTLSRKKTKAKNK